jgi:hypothetical protein
MKTTEVAIEDMSHLTSGFGLALEGNKHFSQLNGTPIKCILYFVVPYEDPEFPFKFCTVHVPRGTPLGRLRALIAHVEAELRSIYGDVKRANFVLIQNKPTGAWELSYTLPAYSVMFE